MCLQLAAPPPWLLIPCSGLVVLLSVLCEGFCISVHENDSSGVLLLAVSSAGVGSRVTSVSEKEFGGIYSLYFCFQEEIAENW